MLYYVAQVRLYGPLYGPFADPYIMLYYVAQVHTHINPEIHAAWMGQCRPVMLSPCLTDGHFFALRPVPCTPVLLYPVPCTLYRVLCATCR